jgi:alkylation response protein AidB-like acyl-CoA dehydrogenase
MDFRLTEEQEMLRDGARRFVVKELDYAARAKRIARAEDCWPQLAELGWLMLAVPEAAGGLDRPLEDIAIIAEELGRGLALEPFICGAFLPSRLLALAGAPAEPLTALASGERRFAVALHETPQRYALDGLATVAAAEPGNGFRLDGRKTLVLGGAEADRLIVAARLGAGTKPALFLVDAAAPGVSRRGYRTIDELAAADISFDAVRLPADALLAGPEAAPAILEQALDEAIVLLCADALGCMDRAIELTAEYLRIRKQFGQALAGFQALQHGVANLFIEANDARSMVYRALAACADHAPERARAVSACKIKVMEAGRLIAGQAVHFHGGIGLTVEYPVGEHLRRILVAEQLFGNPQHHFERYMASRAG